MFFRSLALYLRGNQKLEEETSKNVNAIINDIVGLYVTQFHGVHMNNYLVVEEIITNNTLSYDFDIVNGNIIDELARRSMKNFENTLQTLRYNNHICCMNNINAVFKLFRCPSCDTFFNKTSNLERPQTTCSERGKHLYPKNAHQVRETLIDKMDSFGFTYTN